MRWKSINFKSIFGIYTGLHFVFEFFKVASNAILNGITKGLGRPDQNRLNLHLNKSCIHSDDFSETLFPDFWPLTEFLLWSRRQLKYRFSSRFFPRWPGARRFLSDSSDYGRASPVQQVGTKLLSSTFCLDWSSIYLLRNNERVDQLLKHKTKKECCSEYRQKSWKIQYFN